MKMKTTTKNNNELAAATGIIVDVEALKSRHDENSISYYIWSIVLHCKLNAGAFWALENTLKLKGRMISVPLIIISSATSLTSVALQQSYSPVTSAAIIGLGVASSALIAFQKMTNYSERAEGAKHIAKAYARLARRIETTMVLVEAQEVSMNHDVFLNFISSVEKDLDTIINDTDEVPDDVLKSREGFFNRNSFKKSSVQVELCDEKQEKEIQHLKQEARAMFRHAQDS